METTRVSRVSPSESKASPKLPIKKAAVAFGLASPLIVLGVGGCTPPPEIQMIPTPDFLAQQTENKPIKVVSEDLNTIPQATRQAIETKFKDSITQALIFDVTQKNTEGYIIDENQNNAPEISFDLYTLSSGKIVGTFPSENGTVMTEVIGVDEITSDGYVYRTLKTIVNNNGKDEKYVFISFGYGQIKTAKNIPSLDETEQRALAQSQIEKNQVESVIFGNPFLPSPNAIVWIKNENFQGEEDLTFTDSLKDIKYKAGFIPTRPVTSSTNTPKPSTGTPAPTSTFTEAPLPTKTTTPTSIATEAATSTSTPTEKPTPAYFETPTAFPTEIPIVAVLGAPESINDETLEGCQNTIRPENMEKDMQTLADAVISANLYPDKLPLGGGANHWDSVISILPFNSIGFDQRFAQDGIESKIGACAKFPMSDGHYAVDWVMPVTWRFKVDSKATEYEYVKSAVHFVVDYKAMELVYRSWGADFLSKWERESPSAVLKGFKERPGTPLTVAINGSSPNTKLIAKLGAPLQVLQQMIETNERRYNVARRLTALFAGLYVGTPMEKKDKGPYSSDAEIMKTIRLFQRIPLYCESVGKLAKVGLYR